VIDHDSGQVVVAGEGQSAAQLARAAASGAAAPERRLALKVQPSDPPEAHRAAVVRARELIVAGDLYQVNLARRFEVEIAGGDAPLEVLAALSRRAPADYAALVDLDDGVKLLSTSPELLLRAEIDPAGRFGRLVTEPIKGTRPRGDDAASDAALARELDADEKERAELAMIIDVERNDLSRLCQVGSVRIAAPPMVVTHRTLHHRRARVSGLARADASRREILEAMVPSGSVTGAPKVRAMEVIGELERHRRGLYTGGYGYVAHDGSMTLAMAIRTLALAGRCGHYFAGGGIVADSDPDAEVRETGWKALQLSSSLSGR
jgi:anthranilate/para-aminobenzoate synthase component I